MKNQNFTVVIVGGGKVGLRLATGISRFISKIQDYPVLTKVLRLNPNGLYDEKAELFSSLLNVEVKVDFKELLSADLIIFAIPPVEDVTKLLFAKTIPYLTQNKETPLVSFTSGLSIRTMNFAFQRVQKNGSNVFRATLNTNVDTGHGIFYFSSGSAGYLIEYFFSQLGKVHFAKANDLKKFIAAVGSGNAYDIAFIQKRLEEKQILETDIKSLTRMVSLVSRWRYGNKTKSFLFLWFNQKVSGYKAIGIPQAESILLAKETFLSAAEALIDDSKKGIPFSKRLASVPTPNGCTENQLKRQQSMNSSYKMTTIISSMIFETFFISRTMKVNAPNAKQEGAKLYQEIISSKTPMFE